MTKFFPKFSHNLRDLNKRMESLEKCLLQLDDMKAAITDCRKRCEDTSASMKAVLDKVDDMENRSRRCNLIFYGVPDMQAREPPAESEKEVLKIVSKLGVGPVQIERTHRLGKYRVGKTRPLIANFAFYKQKHDVLVNAKKLKGTEISISEDFSQTVRTKRKMLWEFAQNHRTDGSNVKLRYDVLYLNDVKYEYDESLKQVVEKS